MIVSAGQDLGRALFISSSLRYLIQLQLDTCWAGGSASKETHIHGWQVVLSVVQDPYFSPCRLLHVVKCSLGKTVGFS